MSTRDEILDGLTGLVEALRADPRIPVSESGARVTYSVLNTDDDTGLAELHRIAGVLGVEVTASGPDHYYAVKQFGAVDYEAHYVAAREMAEYRTQLASQGVTPERLDEILAESGEDDDPQCLDGDGTCEDCATFDLGEAYEAALAEAAERAQADTQLPLDEAWDDAVKVASIGTLIDMMGAPDSRLPLDVAWCQAMYLVHDRADYDVMAEVPTQKQIDAWAYDEAVHEYVGRVSTGGHPANLMVKVPTQEQANAWASAARMPASDAVA